MKSECLSFQSIPHSSRLFLDYLYGFEKVRRFFPRPPFARAWASEQAGKLHYDNDRRQRVAGILERQNRAWGASPETLENIARFRSGASAVVTGQQVALFGGPLFSIYKALAAIKLATEFSHAGVDCVPVFWLATEDHDFEEVNHVTLLGPDGTLARFAIASAGPEGAPMSQIRLEKGAEEQVAGAVRFLGEGEVAGILRETYRAGESIGGAFARLFSRLFSHSGVVLIDASDPELHALAEPVYRAAIVGAQDLDQALLERNGELEMGGYHAQVHVTPSSTLLFSLTSEGLRVPVHRDDGQFTIEKETLNQEELLGRISAEPQRFSANVLLRPVVEDFLLPTVAYVGGPAEIAYFAQAAVVYEQLLGRVTTILPRFSATLVEPRVQRLLQRYQLGLPDTFHGPEHLQVVLAEHTLPEEVNRSFDSASQSLERSLAEISAALSRLDPTLVEAGERAGSKMRYQLERLHERAARALSRRSEEQALHSQVLASSLYPERELQERQVGGISFLARYGSQLLLTLYDAAQTSCPDHQIVYL